MTEYLDTTGLAYFWKGTKKVFVKKDDDQANQYIRIIDDGEGGETIFAITDVESNILMSIDEDGVSHFPTVSVDNNLSVSNNVSIGGTITNNGTVFIEDCKVVQYDNGLFYILDNEDHILFQIKTDGSVDFKGIPRDVQTALDNITTRLAALEAA